MDFDAAQAYLYGLGNETIAMKLGLANTERLLDVLGRPQDAFRKVQIAGTNGKGSTAAFLESICHAAGWRVGLNTSPHLVEVTERIRINGTDINRADFARSVEEVRAAAEQLRAENIAPTFFEHLTALALVAFRRAGVDVAVLETGLGGRLDATTVAGAEIVGLTPIALDHTRILGDTLEAIAAEKAAIIRPGTVAFSATQPVAAKAVIDARGAACGVVPRYATDTAEILGATADGRLRVTFTTPSGHYENIALALRGRHQITNAALALELAEAWHAQGLAIPHEAFREGLATARHAGRLDWRAGTPAMLYDGAHNEAGALALRDYLKEFVQVPVTLVFGTMRDKNVARIAEILFPLADKIVLTQPSQPRAATPAEIAAVAPHAVRENILQEPEIVKALRLARTVTSADGLILLTGSLYLVGAALRLQASGAL